MNKKMRDLLAAIEAKSEEAKGLLDGDAEMLKAAMAEIDGLKVKYEAVKTLYELESKAPAVGHDANKDGGLEENKAFADYLRGNNKALTAGANGAITPTTIASKIIETVAELSPIYSRCTRYNVKGKFGIPTYGADSGDQIQAAYSEEFADLTAHAGRFTSVDLESHAIGALTKISKSLINNTDIDVVGFSTRKIAKAIADFMERELLVGTGASGHMTGATKTTNLKTLDTNTIAGVTADVLIDVQLSVPEVYSQNACWIVNKTLFGAIRKIKDGSGRYLCTEDFMRGFGWMLLGKPIYISDNMPAVAASSVPLLYGDFAGLACKLSKDVEIQTLIELYAPQHAVGIVGWVEADSKVENSQMFIGLKMSA